MKNVLAVSTYNSTKNKSNKKLFPIIIFVLVQAIIWSPLSDLVSISFAATKNYYVDYASGSDSNSGLSQNAPWKTITKVNSVTLSPGDHVLFKRGSVWQGDTETLIPRSGDSSAPVYYGSYGEGDRPKLTSAVSRNNTTGWSNDSGNLWSTPGSLSINSTEMLTNPSAESGTTGWMGWFNSANSAAGSLTATSVSGEHESGTAGFKLAVTNSGSALGDVQFVSSAMTVNAGDVYQLDFSVKNNASSDIIGLRGSLLDRTSPYTGRSDNIDFTTQTGQWQKKSFFFKANSDSLNAAIYLYFGDIENGTDIFIDSLSLRKIDFSNGYVSKDVAGIYSKGGSIGSKVWSLTELNSQGDYYFDPETHKTYIYSTSNPATYYAQDLVLAKTANIFDAADKSYVEITDIDFTMGGAHGVSMDDSHYITITDCSFSFIGGGDQQITNNGNPVRYGNAIQLWNSGSHITAARNKIDNIYDAGLTVQGSGLSSISDVLFVNNIVTNSEYGIEFWEKNPGTTISNLRFENNAIINSGYGWGHNQRPDGPNGHSYLQYKTDISSVDNFQVRNNIFMNATEGIYKMNNVSSWQNVANIDYNYIYNESPILGIIGLYSNINDNVGTVVSYSFDQEQVWRSSGSGKDSNSIITRTNNPVRLLAGNSYELFKGSGAIDKGFNNGIDYDFYNNAIVGQRDMGAIEYPYSPTDEEGAVNENVVDNSGEETLPITGTDSMKLMLSFLSITVLTYVLRFKV